MFVAASVEQERGWPSGLEVRDDDLVFDGCAVSEIAERYGTPLWIFSRSVLEENLSRFLGEFRERYPATDVAFSMKAQNTMAVIRILHSAGAKLDCTGENEMQMALQCGVPAADMIVNGNGKSDGTLRAAATLGVLQVNVDSLDEIERLDAIAAELDVEVDCAVRVQLTYRDLLADDPSFETTLRVGEGKFGNNIANGDARRAVERIQASERLRFVGLHHHVGFSGYMGDYTPEREVMHHRACTAEVCEFASELRSQLGVECERLDLGGGFRGGGAVYLADPGTTTPGELHRLPELSDYIEAIVTEIERAFPPDRLPRIQFESGGYQVANAAMFVTRVVEVKRNHGAPPRDYIATDGSMQMFTSKGGMRVASPVLAVGSGVQAAEGRGETLAELVGQTCVYDSLAENIPLTGLKAGDLMVLLQHGAYCDTSGTQMNAFGRPGTVLADRGRAELVKRPEELADIVGRNRVPAYLYGGAS